MLSVETVRNYIENTKKFWKVSNFQDEILNWRFHVADNHSNVFNIGHPSSSHKGSSVGDVLPYTRLPEIIKEKRPDSKVYVPDWFKPFFEHNPYINGFHNNYSRWGSLGTWGSTIQRTANVWGFHTFKFSPIIYLPEPAVKRSKNSILFCINSKTGGMMNNLSLMTSIISTLRNKYYCVQMGLKDDPIIPTANEFIFNVKRDDLVKVVSQFDTYLGVQNSIYHLSKSLGLNVIGILPENVIPKLVMLPLLTQINHLELEMLSDKERARANRWISWSRGIGINPDESHHIGWLYPDTPHLTSRTGGTDRCPTLTIKNVEKALSGNIYPFNDDRLWDIDKHRDLWR